MSLKSVYTKDNNRACDLVVADNLDNTVLHDAKLRITVRCGRKYNRPQPTTEHFEPQCINAFPPYTI